MIVVGNNHDPRYQRFVRDVAVTFAEIAASETLFTTNTIGAWPAYLRTFPEGQRQFHNCNACRRFVEDGLTLAVLRDGNIVSIAGLISDRLRANGWGDDWELAAIAAVAARVAVSVALAPLYVTPEEVTIGRPVTGHWSHMYAILPERCVRLDPNAVVSEIENGVTSLDNVLTKQSLHSLNVAVEILKSGMLLRAEKALPQAEFILELKRKLNKRSSVARRHILIQAACEAPAGFCHPNASMVGTLLEGINARLPVEELARRWNEKMDPMKYQRPTAPLSEGQIREADRKAVEAGISKRTLERRFARIDEVETVWARLYRSPIDSYGPFRALGARDPESVIELHGVTPMTWTRFARELLPRAHRIQVVFALGQRYPLGAYLTAVNYAEPSLFQWDNHLSIYMYKNGSIAGDWALPYHTRVDVLAVGREPWPGLAHHNPLACLILSGARDPNARCSAIFPEHLKGEYREMRRAIAAYSDQHAPARPTGQLASGLLLTPGWCNHQIRVTTASSVGTVHIDRWE